MNTHTTIKGYAGLSRGTPLLPFEYNPSPLAAEQVEIAVNYCDVCPSDISMIDDVLGFSAFPLVPGHEVVGTIAAAGLQVKHLQVGQRVGLGWQSASCLFCHQCRSGDRAPLRCAPRSKNSRCSDLSHGHWQWRLRGSYVGTNRTICLPKNYTSPISMFDMISFEPQQTGGHSPDSLR